MGEHLIRNVFDQYHQPENRLTHALVQVLARDERLTRDFIRFATGSRPPTGACLCLSCQLLPGEHKPLSTDEEDAERLGLPDAWIYDDHDEWAVVLECKVTAGLTTRQLVKHAATARRRGFHSAHLLVITAHESVPAPVEEVSSSVPISWVNWPQVYGFFAGYKQSPLVSEFVSYMRVLEGHLMADGSNSPPLTKFAGIPFGPDYPYNESEAKVVLRALMSDLCTRLDDSTAFSGELRIDRARRRPAMMGSWEIAGFEFAKHSEPFTRHPHLTVSIWDEACIALTLPNNAESGYWRRVRNCSVEQLRNILAEVAARVYPLRRPVERAAWEPRLAVGIWQRHFYAQKHPTIDGILRFDIDALRDNGRGAATDVKRVPAWLDAVHCILGQSHLANFELWLEARFPLSEKSVCRKVDFVETLAKCTEGFAPFLSLLRESRSA